MAHAGAHVPVESRGRVLVVDDDDDVRRMIATWLERSGFLVDGAPDGEGALLRVREQRYDVVVLDDMMPGVSGLEVLKRVRQTLSADELPIIMATARVESDDVVRALASGANDYVTKPLDRKVLVARIDARLADRARASGPPAPSSERAPGEQRVLHGRYRLEDVIGRGGDGVVWRARHVELDRMVAVKLIDLSGRDDATIVRFREEGISTCRVNHPNAVQVSDFGVTDDGLAYLVMELLAGVDLAVELHVRRRLTPMRALEIVRPVCAALAEAHAAGVVHRDIKPGNIFLHKNKRGEVVKVLDFGIAGFLRDVPPEHRPTSQIAGTLSYTAPERLCGGRVDGSADVYSLGMVIHEMLVGTPPFDTLEHPEHAVAAMHVYETPPLLSQRAPDLPAALDDVVAVCLEKDPLRRPSPELLAVRFAQAVVA